MHPEIYFLKYAFPCSFVLKKRKEITEKEFNLLQDSVTNGKILPRRFLEKIFFRAFRRIEKLAQEMSKDKWDIEVLRKYFFVRHNCVIDNGQDEYRRAPEVLKSLCKVHKAKIIQVNEDSLVVEYDGRKKRVVSKLLVPEVVEGNLVTIHYGYAVEKL